MPRLARAGFPLLCRLADPQGTPPDAEQLDGFDPDAILSTAIDHRVYPTVVRKLRSSKWRDSPAIRPRLDVARQDVMYIRAVTMALREFGERLTAALQAADVDHALVKGEAFSHTLYPDPFDRPYTDIDILLPRKALPAAIGVMESLDLVSLAHRYFDRSEQRGEHKWGDRSAPHLFAELHTDLIHFPWLRPSLSFSYEDYLLAGGHGKHPISGHLVVAVVHAAAGHRFDILRVVVDILQALRKLPAADLPHLEDAITTLRLQPEFAASLSLVDELFPGSLAYHPIQAMREKLGLNDFATIVGARTVFYAPDNRDLLSWLVRYVFRFYQRSLVRRSR